MTKESFRPATFLYYNHCRWGLWQSCFLWVGLFFFVDGFESLFFPSLLVLGEVLAFQYAPLLFTEDKARGEWEKILLFESLCLLGLAFHLQSPLILPLSLIPALSFFGPGAQRSNQTKVIIFLLIMSGAWFFYREALTDGIWPTSLDLFLITSFLSWSLVLFMNPEKQFEGKFFKENIEQIGGDELFFHDLINTTHGLNYFLSSKTFEGLSPEETKMVKEELINLQDLIQDHFPFSHRNLEEDRTYRSIAELKRAVTNLVSHQIDELGQTAHLNFSKELEQEKDKHKVHFPFVHRMIVNFLKNALEAGGDEIELVFSKKDNGLRMIFQNRLNSLHSKEEDLSENLGRLIKSGNHQLKNGGRGLVSIENLVSKLGGRFHFQIKHGCWIGEVWIPFEKTLPEEKLAA